jgi:hypothetical protein
MASQGSTLFLIPFEVDRMAEARRLAPAFLSSPSLDASAPDSLSSHPDLLWLTAPSGKAAIGIDQIRDVLRDLQYAPERSPRKLCLVPRAEDLTGPAANALLKALEEPPRDALFVLLARHAAAVLPTIASRLRIQRVPPPSDEEARRRLLAAGLEGGLVERLLEEGLTPAELDAAVAAETGRRGAIAGADEALRSAEDEALLEAIAGEPNPLLRRWASRELLARIVRGGAALAVAAARVIAGAGRDAGERRRIAAAFIEDIVRLAARGVRRSVGTGAAEGQRLAALCQAAQRAHEACERYAPADAVLLALLLDVRDLSRG